MIEAMKQTLKALERSVATCFDQYSHQQVMSQPDHFINQAITSLRKAIAEAEKQEPVAWMTIDSNGEEDDIWYDNPEGKLLEGWSCKPLYTHPQPKAEKQEPVGWIDSKGNMLCVKINESCRPLYTHPQPRKPLTDEQIDEIADTVANMPLVGIVNDFRTRFARAIEAVHGIKE